MKAVFKNIAIKTIVGVVPKNISYFDDEISNYSHSPENSAKLKKTMGYNQHRIVRGDATTADLACEAAQKLFSDGLFSADNIRRIRPGFGLPPRFYEPLIGSICKKGLDAGEAITFEHTSLNEH